MRFKEWSQSCRLDYIDLCVPIIMTFFERNWTTNMWSNYSWNFQYFVWTSFCTSFYIQAVVVLLPMTHTDDIDAMIIRKSSESSSTTELDQIVDR